MNLEELRARLIEIDRKILDLVAERQQVVKDIGQVKRAVGRQTRDFARERKVVENARSHADSVGVPPELAETLVELLIHWSLTDQEQARVRASTHGSGKAALVIGGSGKMGGWFVDFLDSQGFDVTIADPKPPARPGFVHVDDWTAAAGSFDVTVVATPIGVSVGVLEALVAAPPSGLIFDIGSLKTPLIPALSQLAAQGTLVTSLHPMFGPATNLLSGRHVLFLEVGVPAATEQAKQLFAPTMAETFELPIQSHDRLIAYVLGLSHALNIAFFTALAESGTEVPELAQLSSTTFDAQLDVATRVADESPELYFEIQSLNPHGLDPLDKLADAVRQIARVVRDADEPAFVELMDRGRQYLASRR